MHATIEQAMEKTLEEINKARKIRAKIYLSKSRILTRYNLLCASLLFKKSSRGHRLKHDLDNFPEPLN